MVVVDIETTGLDPIKNSIIEIGAIDFFNPTNQFNQRCKVRLDAIVNIKSLEVNGYTKEELYDDSCQSENELVNNFINWIKYIDERTLVGQNVNFDLSFLKASIERFNIQWDFGRRLIDIHTLAYTHMVKSGIKVPLINCVSSLNGDRIMDYVGLPEEPKPHTGINGAKYEAEAISRLIYGKGLFVEFEKFIIRNS